MRKTNLMRNEYNNILHIYLSRTFERKHQTEYKQIISKKKVQQQTNLCKWKGPSSISIHSFVYLLLVPGKISIYYFFRTPPPLTVSVSFFFSALFSFSNVHVCVRALFGFKFSVFICLVWFGFNLMCARSCTTQPHMIHMFRREWKKQTQDVNRNNYQE